MNRKFFLIFNIVFLLTLNFLNTKIVYGYTVEISQVYNAHIKYDPSFYNISESTCIYAAVAISEIGNPLDFTVEVKAAKMKKGAAKKQKKAQALARCHDARATRRVS